MKKCFKEYGNGYCRKNIMKRWLCLLLAILLAFATIPTRAEAKVTKQGKTKVWDSNKGKYVKKNTYKITTKKELRNHLYKYIKQFKMNPNVYIVSKKIDFDSVLLEAIEKLGNYKSVVQSSRFYSSLNIIDNKKLYSVNISFDTERIAEEKYVDEAVKEIIASLNLNGKSEYEKVKDIYFWLLKNNSYAYKDNESGQKIPDKDYHSVYDVLKYGKSVCEGYALTLTRLLSEAGIKSEYISGVSGESLAGHAWNMIQVDNVWYYADATWDDGEIWDNVTSIDYYLLGGKYEKDEIVNGEVVSRTYTVPNGVPLYFLKGSENFDETEIFDADGSLYKKTNHIPTINEKNKSLINQVSKIDFDPSTVLLPIGVRVPEKLIMLVGDTYSLHNKVANSYSLISTDETVVKISNDGKINAVSRGKAFIKIMDNSKEIKTLEIITYPLQTDKSFDKDDYDSKFDVSYRVRIPQYVKLGDTEDYSDGNYTGGVDLRTDNSKVIFIDGDTITIIGRGRAKVYALEKGIQPGGYTIVEEQVYFVSDYDR